MNDFLYRGLIKDFNIRFSYGLTTHVANDAVKAHGCDPVVAHILSRVLTSGVLCSPTLTDDERATATWTYPGPIGKIVVDYGVDADVRGMTKVKTLMDQVESEADVYGDTGNVQIMKFDSKRLISNGTCEAPIMDPIADLSYFYSVSEQLETDMYISVGFNPDPEKPVDLCQGILLQAMPDCDFEALDRLRSVLNSDEFKSLLNSHPGENPAEAIIKALIEKEETQPEYEIHNCPEPKFHCPCSREKTQGVLKTLGEADVKDIVAKAEPVNVACHFCSTVYSFSPEEVQKIAAH